LNTVKKTWASFRKLFVLLVSQAGYAPASSHCVGRNFNAHAGTHYYWRSEAAVAADSHRIWRFLQVCHQDQVPCRFSDYLLHPVFLLGKEEYQVLIRWKVAAGDQLWIGPQGWSSLSMSSMCSGFRFFKSKSFPTIHFKIQFKSYKLIDSKSKSSLNPKTDQPCSAKGKIVPA